MDCQHLDGRIAVRETTEPETVRSMCYGAVYVNIGIGRGSERVGGVTEQMELHEGAQLSHETGTHT